MNNGKYSLLLADDDEDDCMLFKEALEELSMPATFNMVNNGAELMNFLGSQTTKLPHILFLDLNMPRKTGFECLSEIRANEKLRQLTVIIYSTSSNPDMIDLLYKKGAQYYIRKPADFANLKSVIHKVLSLSTENKLLQPSREQFVITLDKN